MDQVRHAVCNSVYLREDLDCDVDHHGIRHLDRDEEEKKQPGAGEQNRAEEQKRIYASGCPHDGNPGHSLHKVEHIAYHAAQNPAEEIEEHELPCPQETLQRASEHYQGEHVEEQMPHAPMDEHVCQKLPHPAHVDAAGNQAQPVDEPHTLEGYVRVIDRKEHQHVDQHYVDRGIGIRVFELLVQKRISHHRYKNSERLGLWQVPLKL